jgi:CheY-like chemotaxis protein
MSWGFRVTETSGGAEALRELQMAVEPFAVALLDYQMPEMDGLLVQPRVIDRTRQEREEG